MASSLNKVTIIGNLGKDPEIRHTQDNNAIANLTVACSESWISKDGGKQDKTEWVKVVVFGKLAEIVEKYLKKGAKVYFEGKLQTRKWQNKDGVDVYTTEVVVDSFGGKMIMLGGNTGVKEEPKVKSSEPDFDDDIPF